MNIKSIQIKNVRGLQDHTVELGQMYPNKPSLMVAPNGSGKSTIMNIMSDVLDMSSGKIL